MEDNMPLAEVSVKVKETGKGTATERKAQNNHLAIALASISDQDYPVDFTLNTAEYCIGGAGEVLLHDENGVRKLGDYSGQASHVVFTLPKRGICFVEMIPAL